MRKGIGQYKCQRLNQKACLLPLETYYTPFGSQFDQFRGPGKGHVGIEIFLANLASFSAGRSDVDRHFVFHQIGEKFACRVVGSGLFVQAPVFVRPIHAIIGHEQASLMPLGMSHFGHLKRARGSIYVSSFQVNCYLRHFQPLSFFLLRMVKCAFVIMIVTTLSVSVSGLKTINAVS